MDRRGSFFIYLGKNYVRILGGIAPTLQRAISFSKVRVIQLRGEFASIAEEADEAISSGADVLMVDTGSWKDLDDVLRESRKGGLPIGFGSPLRVESN
jgi:nicotinate-nucleotide pyrophosphorylase (carboxylating)